MTLALKYGFTEVVDKIRKPFIESSFLTHVLAVSGSTVACQLISLVVAPINTRLYQPADYGTMAMFTALFLVLSIPSTMRYEGALPIASDDTEATHLLLLCTLLSGVTAIIAAIVVLYAGSQLATWLGMDYRMAHYLWYFPVGLFANSIFNILSAWAIRKHAFSELSTTKVLQSLLVSIVTVSLGFLGAGFPGMIAGALISSYAGLYRLVLLAYRAIRIQAPNLSFGALINEAKRHYRFPLYNTWGLLLNTFSIQLPIFMLTSGFGNTYSGYFSICQRVLVIPTLLISGAIAPVFYSRARKAVSDGNIKQLTLRILKSIAGVNAFFIMFVGMFGEPLFSLAFGAQWARSGAYASALAPWLLFNFLVTPLASLPLILERQKTDLLFQIVLFAVRALSISIGIYFHNDMIGMIAFGSASALYMIVYFVWLLKLVAVKAGDVFLRVGREVALAALLLGICRIVMYVSNNNLMLTAIILVPVLAFAAIRALKQLNQSRV